MPVHAALSLRASPARPVARLATVGPVLVALVCFLGLLYGTLQSHGFNPSGAAMIGDQFDGRRFWAETTIVKPGIGYDGQFFFYLAHDPLLLGNNVPGAFLDRPAYRAARVLYPALAWAAALGRPEAIPWALLGVNLAAALVGTAAAADVLRSLGASRWLALGFAFSPAILLGLIADLAEPTAFALVALGFALHLRARHRAAGLALALGTLAREVSLLVPLGFALHAAARRAWREAAAYALPQALPIAWHLWLWAKLGALPSAQSPTNFGVPFGGAAYRLGVLLGWQAPLLGEPRPDEMLPELILMAASVALIVVGLLKIFRRRDVFAVQLWLQAAAVVGTSPLVWIGLGSYGRVLGLLYLFYGLAVLTERRRGAASRTISRAAGGRLRSGADGSLVGLI